MLEKFYIFMGWKFDEIYIENVQLGMFSVMTNFIAYFGIFTDDSDELPKILKFWCILNFMNIYFFY